MKKKLTAAIVLLFAVLLLTSCGGEEKYSYFSINLQKGGETAISCDGMVCYRDQSNSAVDKVEVRLKDAADCAGLKAAMENSQAYYHDWEYVIDGDALYVYDGEDFVFYAYPTGEKKNRYGYDFLLSNGTVYRNGTDGVVVAPPSVMKVWDWLKIDNKEYPCAESSATLKKFYDSCGFETSEEGGFIAKKGSVTVRVINGNWSFAQQEEE